MWERGISCAVFNFQVVGFRVFFPPPSSLHGKKRGSVLLAPATFLDPSHALAS